MTIEKFREYVNLIANYEGYVPVKTEILGACNIISGVMQIVVGNCMKYHSQPKIFDVQSKKHIGRGCNTLKIGVKQCLPAVVTVSSLYILNKKWRQLKHF